MIPESIKALVAEIAQRYHVPIIVSDDLAQVNPADPRRLVVGCQKADASPTDVSEDPHLKPIMDGNKRVASYSVFGVYLRFHPDDPEREALATRIIRQYLPDLAQGLNARQKANVIRGLRRICQGRRHQFADALRQTLSDFNFEPLVLESVITAMMATPELRRLLPVPDVQGAIGIGEEVDDISMLIPKYYLSFQISEIPGIFEGRLVGSTQPILIRQEDAVYRFDPYTVIVDLEELTVSIGAGTPSATGAIHPHVRSFGSPITGDLAELMRYSLQRNNLVQTFALAHLFLSHYNPATCCEPIENWTPICRASDNTTTAPSPIASVTTPDIIMMLASAAAERAGLTDLVIDNLPQG